jgi:hypothetical protein
MTITINGNGLHGLLPMLYIYAHGDLFGPAFTIYFNFTLFFNQLRLVLSCFIIVIIFIVVFVVFVVDSYL